MVLDPLFDPAGLRDRLKLTYSDGPAKPSLGTGDSKYSIQRWPAVAEELHWLRSFSGSFPTSSCDQTRPQR